MPTITYTTDTAAQPGYLAVPSSPPPWPAVVIIQDIRGMTADLEAQADRFAAEGYLALAPRLYRRRCVRSMAATIQSHFSGAGDAFDDIAAAREYLLADERCTGKAGIVGFCFGAGLALMAAPSGQFDAAGANYGLLPSDLSIMETSCPLVASFGAKDRIVKPGSAAELETALTQYGVPHDVKEYPDVGHAFASTSRVPAVVRRLIGMQYSGPAAEDSWQRLFAFFAVHLA